MAEDVAAIVLAAGKGTRFRSELAKVLHRAAGRTLVAHVLEAVRPLAFGQVVVVVGHQADQVRAEVETLDLPGVTFVEQTEQRGTGHAVQQAVPALADGIGRVMILPGDTPLLTTAWLQELLDAGAAHTAALGTAHLDDPTGYGRVIRSAHGTVERIVEHRDAATDELAVDEINAGMYLTERALLTDALGHLDDDNDQGEIYLTDIVQIARRDGHRVAAVTAPAQIVAGVNDRLQLAEVAATLRRRHLARLMTEVGVSVVDPSTTYVDVDVEVGRDATLLPGTILERGTRIGPRATIGPNSHLTDCEVAADATVHSTRAVRSTIGPGADVGPFTHLRPGTVLGVDSRVGAFVETKNATFAQGAKAGHLAYVGDASVGERVNVGCGVVTVNFDGRAKHRTVIEADGFIGSGAMLVAPLTVGAGAFVAAGSTITDDVPADALAVARARQTVKERWAEKRREPANFDG